MLSPSTTRNPKPDSESYMPVPSLLVIIHALLQGSERVDYNQDPSEESFINSNNANMKYVRRFTQPVDWFYYKLGIIFNKLKSYLNKKIKSLHFALKKNFFLPNMHQVYKIIITIAS